MSKNVKYALLFQDITFLLNFRDNQVTEAKQRSREVRLLAEKIATLEARNLIFAYIFVMKGN